jgi:hypothetical protein
MKNILTIVYFLLAASNLISQERAIAFSEIRDIGPYTVTYDTSLCEVELCLKDNISAQSFLLCYVASATEAVGGAIIPEQAGLYIQRRCFTCDVSGVYDSTDPISFFFQFFSNGVVYFYAFEYQIK